MVRRGVELGAAHAIGEMVRAKLWGGTHATMERLRARERDSASRRRAGETYEQIGAAHGTSADTARRDVERWEEAHGRGR